VVPYWFPLITNLNIFTSLYPPNRGHPHLCMASLQLPDPFNGSVTARCFRARRGSRKASILFSLLGCRWRGNLFTEYRYDFPLYTSCRMQVLTCSNYIIIYKYICICVFYAYILYIYINQLSKASTRLKRIYRIIVLSSDAWLTSTIETDPKIVAQRFFQNTGTQAQNGPECLSMLPRNQYRFDLKRLWASVGCSSWASKCQWRRAPERPWPASAALWTAYE